MSLETGWGITEQGFVMPQISDLETDLEQGLISQFGAGINLEAESFFGQFVGLTAERLGLVWQAMQDVYDSQTPDTAFGTSLDNVGALRGIPRLQASSSIVQNFRIFGTAGTPVPGTFQVSVVGTPTSIFQITGATTLAAGASCVQQLAFSAVSAAGNWSLAINGSASASLPYNATAAQVQTAIRALNFCSACTVTGDMTAGFTVTFVGAATGGFMVQPLFSIETDTLETVGLVPVVITPSITVPGIDQANVTMAATTTGPIFANASALTNIVTPISGVTAVLNTQDAVPGTNVETDNAYRARMSSELSSTGAGTVPAIRERLLTVAGVTSVIVYENTTDTTNGMGLPPHSFQAVVAGIATQSDIANMIWQTKPAGIATYGNTSFVITDSQGQTHTIYWSTPTQVDIYYIINLLVNANYPINGDVTVQTLVANYTNALGEGVPVIPVPGVVSQLAGIPGIDGVTIYLGTSPSPSGTANIPISAYQVAYTQTDFIIVTASPG